MNDFNASNIWGIDFGGTKIEGIILHSSDDFRELLRIRVPTESHNGYRHILGQFRSLIDQMEAKAGYRPEAIGIATPGTYIPQKGIMKNCNTVMVNGQDLKHDLESMLGVKINLANDANCFALAETKLGIVKDEYPEAQVVFGVILGTGVGGGLVVHGKVIHGRHGIGGEWGHNYLYHGEGKPCYCGKTGCNEQILSGPALEDYYYQLSGIKIPLKEIHHRSKEGNDPVAKKTIDRLTNGFAKALSVVINIVDPDVIVMGGGVSHIDAIYEDVLEPLKEMIFNHEFDTPIVKAKLGDSAGVFGAALLIAENQEKIF